MVCQDGFNPEDLQVTCRSYVTHLCYSSGPICYYRITADKTYTNRAFRWCFVEDWTNGCPDTAYDFQGIVTHELGHWLRLVHAEPPTVNETMRATFTPLESFQARTLTTDDIESANFVVP